MAWYNKYRPTTFEQVVGQNLVKTVLMNSLKLNKIKHGYLFSGSKGTGKTTLARIFAAQLNSTTSNPEAVLDIIEMDAASNTGVDDVRSLIESAQVPPIAGRYKVYIIDEVHMLSKNAMNALLKTLEEPPQHVVFLLATTNAEKLLPTVLSRLTRLNLQNHTLADIMAQLRKIAATEDMTIDDQALELIAKRSGGGQRDAINLLETLSSHELQEYNLQNVAEILGVLPGELLTECANFLQQGKVEASFWLRLESLPSDSETFLGQLLDFLLDKSLSGQRQWDQLITPITEVIALRLPLTSIISTLAVLQARIGGGITTQSIANQTTNTQPQINPNPSPQSVTNAAKPFIDRSNSEQSEQPKQILPEAKQEPQLNSQQVIAVQDNRSPVLQSFEVTNPTSNVHMKSDQILPSGRALKNDPNPILIADQSNNTFVTYKIESVQSHVDTLENLKNQTQDNSNPSSEQSQLQEPNSLPPSHDQIQGFLSNLSVSRSTPPLVKIIMSDLGVESIDGNKLTLSVSNGVFESQLSSPKIRTWLGDSLKAEFGQIYTIAASQRSGKKPNTSVPNTAPINAAATQNPAPAQQVPTQVNTNESKEPTKTKSKELRSEAFYSVYDKLPPNSEGSNVPVFESPIPSPKDHLDWDNVIDGFELEE